MKAFCISHQKDVDGIGAAALVVAATGAEFRLTDYGQVLEDLASVPQDVDRFVLCDIGTDAATRGDFVKHLAALAKRAKVTYIDHHFLDDEGRKQMEAAGVELVHDVAECASMLAYSTFRDSLPEGARYVALYGAVTDYMDDSPRGKKMMEKTDRQFVLAEATLLAFAVAMHGDEKGYPESLVRELAVMKQPHQIRGVVEAAVDQLERVAVLSKEVGKTGKKLTRVAYMETKEHSTGNVAKLLIGAFGTPAGVSYKEKEKGWCEVSLRGTSECRVHLGKAIGAIASGLGGSGGGHALAAGCRVPAGKVEQMLRELDAQV